MKKTKINSGNLESPNKTMLPCDEKVEQNTINNNLNSNLKSQPTEITGTNNMKTEKKSEKPNSTITRKNEGVLVDEYGVIYTADKTKLISTPKNLQKYKIPNSVTSIGDYAFYGCNSLTSIEIPNSVTSIGANPFWGCDKLNDIKINNSNFTFNNGLLISREGVLISCLSNNEKIIIPNSVTSIGDNAFECCTSLTSIEIPNSVTSIGYYAFYGCESLTSIEIPNSVTSIGDSAFSWCYSLESIEIPNSVTSIGANPFLGCDKLNDIKINNSNFTFNNGLLISREGVLISCLSNNEKIIIPNTITSIGESAFRGYYLLTSIEIPNSVTSIGNYAFECCTSLTSIEIPNSVTSIGYFAFCWCYSLKSIEIPNSVTSIGYYAFCGCGKLKSIIVCSDNPYLVKKDGEWLLNLPNGAGIEDIEINIKE